MSQCCGCQGSCAGTRTPLPSSNIAKTFCSALLLREIREAGRQALVLIPALRIILVLAAFILQKYIQLRSPAILLCKHTGCQRGSSYPQRFYNSRRVCTGTHAPQHTKQLAASMQNLCKPLCFVDSGQTKDGFRSPKESLRPSRDSPV